MSTSLTVKALLLFHKSSYRTRETREGTTRCLALLILAQNLLITRAAAYSPIMSCLTLPRSHYLSILHQLPFPCLPLLYHQFAPHLSNRLLNENVPRLYQERALARRPIQDQKSSPVTIVEVCQRLILIYVEELTSPPARKTKCDGAHPACASCARRSLDCNYVHEPSSSNGSGSKKSRRATSNRPQADSPHSLSPPSSRMVPTPSTANDGYEHREVNIRLEGDIDLKRSMEYSDISRASKKMRMDSSPTLAGIS